MKNQQISKISVVLATYNRAHILPTAVNSVFEQEYHNIELIITDDCSIDNTSEVCLKLMSDEPRIKYVKTDFNTGGCIPNLANGVKYASGDYVVFLADDDVFEDSNFFSLAIKMLDDDKDVSFVFSKFAVTDGESRYIRDAKMPTIFDSAFFIKKWTDIQYDLNLATFIIRAGAIKTANIFDNMFSNSPTNDYTAILKLALSANKIGFINIIGHCWTKPKYETHSAGNPNSLSAECVRFLAFPINIEMTGFASLEVKNLLNEYILYAFDTMVANYVAQNFEILCENVKLALKNDFSGKKVYIYGRGEFGQKIFNCLQCAEIDFRGFIDDFYIGCDTYSFEGFIGDADINSVVIVSTLKVRYALQIMQKLTSFRHDLHIISLAALSGKL